ncbi:hypothetical protein ScPMuIL_003954 [Solemya velum]
MADDKSSLLGRSGPNDGSVTDNTLYYGSSQTPKARMAQVLFVALVVVMVLITIALSIFQGVDRGNDGGLYFMLGISLVGFVLVDVFLIIFIRRGDLPEGKTWFLYFIGGCVILEAIFTNVLLFK